MPLVGGLVVDEQLASDAVEPSDPLQVTVAVYVPEHEHADCTLVHEYVTDGVDATHAPLPEQVEYGEVAQTVPDGMLQFGATQLSVQLEPL